MHSSSSSSSSDNKKNVAIVGSGVIGLSIALSLLDHPSNEYQVTIISEHIPGDHSKSYPATFASQWAGAHHVSDAQNDRELSWDQVTFSLMQKLSEQKPWKKNQNTIQSEPLIWVNQTELWSKKSPKPNWKALDWYPGFERIESSQLPSDCSEGCTFSTLDINVPIYLEWLVSEVASRGGKFVEKKVDSLQEVSSSGSFEAIITAVGLGAKNIQELKDDRMVPSRGQVLLVKAPWAKEEGKLHPWSGLSRVGDEGFRDVYVIPRGDDTLVVGGTRIKADWDERPREETTKEILKRVLKFVPQIAKPGSQDGEVDLVSVNVGLRPVREGGARLEVGEKAGGIKVVHAYGFGGFGYQSSFGIAFEVRGLVDNAFSFPSAEQQFKTLL